MISINQTLLVDGTNNVRLDTSDQQFQLFVQTAGFVNVDYLIINQNLTQYERGIGTIGVGGLLTRTAIVASSNSNAIVDFGKSSCYVSLTSQLREVYAYSSSSDQTLIGTAFVDVASTGLPVIANAAYEFEFNIIADADATTTGIDVSVNGPAAPTAINYTIEYWTSATAKAFFNATAYDANTASTSSAGATRAIYSVRGVLRNGVNAGTLIGRIKREAVGTGPNVRVGTYSRSRRLS